MYEHSSDRGGFQMPEESRCFIAVFGESHAVQHPVDGGAYAVPLSYCPAIGEGDKVLLFCLKGYPGHSWEAPGIGVVNQTAQRSQNGCVYVDILYEYHPLKVPIRRETIMTVSYTHLTLPTSSE
ncbi:MAG: hypothetical protein QUS33_10360, partial [Dehalococcoidia bacterium]|nr:hypothetical protein [Dehalococcoidia bacterium]